MQAQRMIKQQPQLAAIQATRPQTRMLAARRVVCSAKKESGSEIKLNSALVPGMPQ
jgi:hypothetical protein